MPQPAKSPELHALHGTKSQAKDAGASRIEAGRPKFPRDLSPEAKPEFKRIVRLLERRRQITEGDVEAIRLYCMANERLIAANKKLAEEGLVVKYTRVSNGESFTVEKKNLHLDIAVQAERQMVAILKELGLTPRTKDAVKQTADAAGPQIVPGSMADLYGADLAGLQNLKPRVAVVPVPPIEEL